MAMVAKQFIVWQSMSVKTPGIEESDSTRVEIGIDSVVPDTVPLEIQKEWQKRDWAYEDPTKEHIAASEGPPRMTMPLARIQKADAARQSTGAPVLGKSIPPRPTT